MSSSFFIGPIFPVFELQAPLPNFKGNPLSRDVKYMGEKFTIFDWNLRLSRERHEIGQWLIRKINWTSYISDRFVSVRWLWVILKGGITMDQNFQANLRNYCRTVWLKTNKLIGTVTWARDVFIGVSHAPKGRSPSAPQFWRFSLLMPTCVENIYITTSLQRTDSAW